MIKESVAVKSTDKPKFYIVKRVVVSFVLALLCAVFAFNWGQDYFAKNHVEQVLITAQEGSGNVTFRGAIIDNQWYNPTDIVEDSANWLYDNEYVTFTAVDEEALLIALPSGDSRTLTFNVGPDEGIVFVDVNEESLEFNLWNEQYIKVGCSFSVPAFNTQSILKQVYITAMVVLVTVFLLSFILSLCYNFLLQSIKQYYKQILKFIYYNIEKRKRILEICFFICLLPIIGLLLAKVSVSSTPLVEGFYGYDAAYYTYAANAWAKGLIPYKDFFVNKGPIVYLIYMANVIVGEQWGVFLLQCIAMWLSLLGAYMIAKMIAGLKAGFLSIIGTLVFYLVLVDEGALNEEFNLSFLMFAVYLIIKYILKSDIQRQHPPRYAFFYGITFGVMLWTRVTDSVYLNAFIFTIFVFLVIKHEYKNIMANALAFLLGFGLIFLPVFIYFAVNDALSDLLRLFTANISYSSNSGVLSENTRQSYIYFLMPIWLCLIISIEQKRLLKYGLINASISTALWLYNSYFYPHYYVIILIFIPIFIGLSFKSPNDYIKQTNTNHIHHLKNDKILDSNLSKVKTFMNRYRLVYGLLIFVICINVLQSSIGKINDRKGWIANLQMHNSFEYAYIDAAKELASEIPEGDKNTVVMYGTRPEFSIATDLYPHYELLGGIDWKTNVYAMGESNKQEIMTIDLALIPKWIIVEGKIANDQIQDIIQEEYILINQVKVNGFEDHCIDMYKLKS